MSLLPSPTALRAARAQLHAALVELTPGTVTIDDVVYACAIALGPVEPKLAADGVNYRDGQDATIRIAKTILAAAPDPRTLVTIGGVDFRVINSGPQNDYDVAWHITARRFP